MGWNRHDGAKLLRLHIGAAGQRLRDCGIGLDANGFVLTGIAAGHDTQNSRGANGTFALESSVAGVFAVGDIRSGSVKRVGGAIGEGANVVAQIHSVLAQASA